MWTRIKLRQESTRIFEQITQDQPNYLSLFNSPEAFYQELQNPDYYFYVYDEPELTIFVGFFKNASFYNLTCLHLISPNIQAKCRGACICALFLQETLLHAPVSFYFRFIYSKEQLTQNTWWIDLVSICPFLNLLMTLGENRLVIRICL